MGRRAEPSGLALTAQDASIVKGMLARGDRQHDIAAYFGVNGGRIAEIATGAKFGSIAPAPAEKLPPQGPYPSPHELVGHIEKMKQRIADLESEVHDKT